MIYLFGSNGMLGRYVLNILSKEFEVVPITRNKYDILNDSIDKLKYILNDIGPNDVIVNCSGIIPQKCQLNQYNEYIRVNSIFPHKLCEIADMKKSKFIHISTDCVFNGAVGNYNELSSHNATDIYGTSKSNGEPENATIIRTSIIGEYIHNNKSLLEWVISNKNGKINGYTNYIWNGVTCLTLATIIKDIIINNLYWIGVKHIFSPKEVSKYELCCIINEIYDLNIDITPTNTDIKNMTLSSILTLFCIKDIREQVQLQKYFILYRY